MSTTILHIVRWGSGEWCTVMLGCGHRRRLRRAQLKKAQLFEGKSVECPDCNGKKAQTWTEI